MSTKEMEDFFVEILNIPKQDVHRSFSPWRFNVLHVRGVEALTSEDVFEYFRRQPHSIEWLSNISCNATFDTIEETFEAMVTLGKSVIIHKNEMDFTIDYDSRASKYGLSVTFSNELQTPVPPNYHYILGEKHEKAKSIFFRYATINDKKTNPELIGDGSSVQSTSAIRRQPALPQQLQSSNVALRRVKRINPLDRMDIDYEDGGANNRFTIHRDRFNSRKPTPVIRMRMRADEEEERIRLMKNRRRLSTLPFNRRSVDIRSRLGARGQSSSSSSFSSSLRNRLGNRIESRLSYPSRIQTSLMKNKRTFINNDSTLKRLNDPKRMIRSALNRDPIKSKLDEPIIRVQVSYDEGDITV